MRATLGLALPFVLVGFIFWAVYFAIGSQLAAHHMLHNDILFHSDIQRVVNDMCVADYKHKRTNVHPLFVLFTNPIGVALSSWTGSVALGAVLLSSFCGALCIAFTGWFFFSLGVPRLRALILSAVLGCSAAHLFFGSLPETYSLSALSIVVLFYLANRYPGDLRCFVPAGIFSFGILLTNLAVAVLAFGCSLFSTVKLGREFYRRVAMFVALVVGITALLACVEKLVWPQTELFFAPSSYTGESHFVKIPKGSGEFGRRERLLLRYVLAFDWFAPAVSSNPDEKRELTVRFKNHSLATIPSYGKAAMVIWSALILGSAFAFIRYRLFTRPLLLGLLLSLFFNLALHSVYGDDLFLYSCNTCFLLLAWMALCMSEFRLSPVLGWGMNSALLVLLGLEVANNVQFVAILLAQRHS